MDTQYLIQLLTATHTANGVAQTSTFFMLPKELRLLIYEFVFSSFAPSHGQTPLPKSSLHLRPLRTCRQFYQEAKVIAFKLSTHNLNWTRSSSCFRHLLDLEPTLHTCIRHVAMVTSAAGLYDMLQPLRYHFDHMRHPFLALDTLTIVLEPANYEKSRREKRIEEMNMVLSSVWYYKNVKKVIIQNVLHREMLRDHPASLGFWTCTSGEALGTDQALWQVELTQFHNYGSEPGFRPFGELVRPGI